MYNWDFVSLRIRSYAASLQPNVVKDARQVLLASWPNGAPKAGETSAAATIAKDKCKILLASLKSQESESEGPAATSAYNTMIDVIDEHESTIDLIGKARGSYDDMDTDDMNEAIEDYNNLVAVIVKNIAIVLEDAAYLTDAIAAVMSGDLMDAEKIEHHESMLQWAVHAFSVVQRLTDAKPLRQMHSKLQVILRVLEITGQKAQDTHVIRLWSDTYKLEHADHPVGHNRAPDELQDLLATLLANNSMHTVDTPITRFFDQMLASKDLARFTPEVLTVLDELAGVLPQSAKVAAQSARAYMGAAQSCSHVHLGKMIGILEITSVLEQLQAAHPLAQEAAVDVKKVLVDEWHRLLDTLRARIDTTQASQFLAKFKEFESAIGLWSEKGFARWSDYLSAEESSTIKAEFNAMEKFVCGARPSLSALAELSHRITACKWPLQQSVEGIAAVKRDQGLITKTIDDSAKLLATLILVKVMWLGKPKTVQKQLETSKAYMAQMLDVRATDLCPEIQARLQDRASTNAAAAKGEPLVATDPAAASGIVSDAEHAAQPVKKKLKKR